MKPNLLDWIKVIGDILGGILMLILLVILYGLLILFVRWLAHLVS